MPTRATDGPLFQVESFTLKNNLRVLVIPNDRAPVVTQMLWYRVGASDEPVGKSGLAHILEHLMFSGHGGGDNNEFSQKIRALGGRDNAFTGQDYTAYFQSIPRRHLSTVMAMEAKRMRRMAFNPTSVERERQVVLEERRQTLENDPRRVFGQRLRSALFRDHPYGLPIIGRVADLKSIDQDDLNQFRQTWYRPNNAILILSGNISVDRARELANKHYGDIPNGDGGIPIRAAGHGLSTVPADDVITMADPRIQQPVIIIKWRAPSTGMNDMGLVEAGWVIQTILGEPDTGKLYQEFVMDEKTATRISYSYQASRVGPGFITVVANPADGVDPNNLRQAIINFIQDTANAGATWADVQSAKDQLILSAVYARDSITGPAMILGQAITTGSTIEQVEQHTGRIEQVSKYQVNQAMRDQFLTNPSMVSGILSPQQQKGQTNE
jgi:zinc protease